MPESLERIRSYKEAFEHLFLTGQQAVVENVFFLAHSLLPTAHLINSCCNGNPLALLHKGKVVSKVGDADDFYTAFLSAQHDSAVFPASQLDYKGAQYFFVQLPLADKDGLVFGKLCWIDEAEALFTKAQLSSLQLAACQLAGIITMHAAELRSQQQLQHYFDNSPLAFVEWDSSFRVLQWSSKAEELFGWKKEEVLGLTAAQFNIVHPDSEAYVQQLVDRTITEKKDTVMIETKNLSKSGEVLFCRWHNTINREGDGILQSVFAMVEDITSIKLANESLYHSEERLEENKTALGKIDDLNKAIIAALPDLMFRLTNDGVFADYYVSENDGSSLYLPPSEFIGKNAADILPPFMVDLLHGAMNQLASGQKIAFYNYQLTMGSDVREFECRLTRINDEGFLSIVRDITEEKKAERLVIYENELLDAVAQIGSVLLSNEDWQAGFEKSLSIIGHSFRVSGVYFFELCPASSVQEAAATIKYEWLSAGVSSQTGNEAFKGVSVAEHPDFFQPLQQNEMLTALAADVQDGCLKNLITQLHSSSVIVVPLVVNDELFGIMVLNESGYNRVWTKEEKSAIRIISHNLITSYKNNQTQKSIRKVNELFGYVMKATNDLIWDWDIENDVIERSENGFKNITGYEYGEVDQTVDFWSTRVHPDDREQSFLNFQAALANPAIFFWENNFRFLKKNGIYSYLVDRCYIIRNEEGKAIRAIGAAQDMTEQKTAVMELAHSEQRFRSMIYNISDVITLLDKNGNIIYQSASSKRILDFDDNELLGKSLFWLLHPDDIERVSHFFNEALLREGDTPLIQFRYLTKKGTYLSLEAIGNNQLNNPAVNAIIVVSRDVTDRLKVGEAIRASEEKFRSLVHNISDIISIISPAGKILYQSSSVKQKMGYEENELSNRSIAEIVHPDDLAELMKAFETLIYAGGTSEPMEFRILNKDGTYFYIEAQATNQINNPTIQGIVITSRDISQRKKTEEERKMLIEELTKNNADLKQFSYIVSHDLRAPVTNLIAMIKLLDFATIQNPRSLKLLEGFKVSTFKLRDTLNDLTNILVVKNNPNVEIKLLEFEKVFIAVSQSINSLIEKSGAVINVDFTEAPAVKFSEPYLESIFQNLLTNSIRYASTDRQLQVQVTTKKQNNNILMTYTDNGIGFNMDVVKGKIFGLHQRFHHHPESRGIGLYLIHSQITALGGTITVQSKEGAGTSFFITLKNS